MGLAYLAGALILALVGAGFCFWAGYLFLADMLGPAPASLLIGGVMLLLAGILAWTVSKLTH